MLKRILSIICLLALICSFSITAYAITSSSNVGTVWFAANGTEMGNDFAEKSLTEDLYKRLSTLQPGDETTFTIKLENRYSKATNWYMTSEILDSLEAGNASGGAYTYELKYNTRTLYNSETVGGDPTSGQKQNEQGLMEVNEALKEDYVRNKVKYFYLDNIKSGGSGLITLKIALDGETQGNDYQDRLADLRMNWAVQIADQTSPSTGGVAPKTGDETNLLPYYIAMFVSGLLFLYFALDAYTDRLYKKGKGKA